MSRSVLRPLFPTMPLWVCVANQAKETLARIFTVGDFKLAIQINSASLIACCAAVRPPFSGSL